jgi:hypothetical protein
MANEVLQRGAVADAEQISPSAGSPPLRVEAAGPVGCPRPAGSPSATEGAARLIRRTDDAEQRGQLADDVRRLAGFADAAVETATRLGAEMPEGVVACTVVWRHWARRLAQWARECEAQ